MRVNVFAHHVLSHVRAVNRNALQLDSNAKIRATTQSNQTKVAMEKSGVFVCVCVSKNEYLNHFKKCDGY